MNQRPSPQPSGQKSNRVDQVGSPSLDDGNVVEADGCLINLKNRYLAAFLAFVLPGAGHFYQGRKNKAYLFAACILGLFISGLFLGQGRVVYMSWTDDDYRLQFPAQLCVGAPAFPALIQGLTREKPVRAAHVQDTRQRPVAPLSLKNFMAPPSDTAELSQWHYVTSAGFEIGTLFTSVAGLLNLLVIFDAFYGPMPIPQPGNRSTKKESK